MGFGLFRFCCFLVCVVGYVDFVFIVFSGDLRVLRGLLWALVKRFLRVGVILKCCFLLFSLNGVLSA